jgi:hypothetical protein
VPDDVVKMYDDGTAVQGALVYELESAGRARRVGA